MYSLDGILELDTTREGSEANAKEEDTAKRMREKSGLRLPSSVTYIALNRVWRNQNRRRMKRRRRVVAAGWEDLKKWEGLLKMSNEYYGKGSPGGVCTTAIP